MKQYLGEGYDQATEKLEWQRKKAFNKLKKHQSGHVSEVIKRKMSVIQPRELPKTMDSKNTSEHGISIPVVEHAHLTVEESQKIWENTFSTLLSNKIEILQSAEEKKVIPIILQENVDNSSNSEKTSNKS